jgi:IS30 family transposase
LLGKNYSLRSIAGALDKSVSTISDELKRNRKKNGHYEPKSAHQKAYVRRRNASFKGKKIVRHENLRKFVEENLIAGQTPQAISGRLRNQEKELPYASKDTIYKYQQSPYGKMLGIKKKKKKRRYGYQAKQRLKDRKFIEKRPKEANLRQRVGDVEADFIVSGKNGKGVLLVVVCRKLRVTFLEIVHEVNIKNIHKSFLRIKNRFPEMKTLTLDNDILFRYHRYLEKLLAVEIYFCRPYHSWEKGTVENVNRQIRKYIPKGSDLSRYDQEEIVVLEKTLNIRFMECLDYKTPLETLEEYRKNKKTTDANCCE